MAGTKLNSKGFTLIAALMLLLILSGISIGLLMMVNTEGKVNTHDVQNNVEFHAAEGGIEHMTADLANMFQNILSPTASEIEALSSLAPTNTALVSYPVYSLTPATDGAGNLSTSWGQIATGNYAGLYAQLLPVALQVTSQGPLGDEVNMNRSVEVALIPVFQFGVFSDSDLGFYSSPNLKFAGRVHTNGDLYLGVADCCTLTFTDKLSAWGNVIREVLPNGLSATSYNDGGTVLIPQKSGACNSAPPAGGNCRAIAQTEGSVTGAGGNPPASGPTTGPPSWQTISLGTYAGFVTDGDWGNAALGTGATNLTLPFVGGTTGGTTGPQPFEIIRRPPTGESSTGALGASRLYNEAEIRILLSDTPADLPGGVADPQNIRLANGQFAGGPNYFTGVPTIVPASMPSLGAGHSYTTYFATATTGVADPSTYSGSYTQLTLPPDWLYQPQAPLAGYVTLYDANAPVMASAKDGSGLTQSPTTALTLTVCNPSTPYKVPPGSGPPVCPTAAASYPYFTPVAYPTLPNTNTAEWNLLDGYLRVEYRDKNGVYHPVTQEWLGLGFARNVLPPTAPLSNTVNPDAILLLQEPADRNGNGTIDAVGAPAGYTSVTKSGVTTYTPFPGKPPDVTTDATTKSPWYGDSAQAGGQSSSQFNWYPINFYDAREGEPRDTQYANNTCTANGVMNAVELDVGNLAKWLNGTIPGSGTNVDYISQNGYIVYFSDRRGMLPNPNGTQVDPVNTKTGDSGLEDSVNRASAAGAPDGGLDPNPPGKTFSDEDVNLNGKLDGFGTNNLGLGLGYIPTPAYPGAYTSGNNVNRQINSAAPADNPYLRMPTCSIAQNNWVSGARHVLKLVDGSLGNLPVRPDNNLGGFTVGSENPVYILGDYNTNPVDPIWSGGGDVAHSAAGIVADAVTMLSDSWLDTNSTLSSSATEPFPNRQGSNTYYRVAIAAGKNINFPFPGWENSTDYGFGTDGGVHNFLRFLEDWQDPGATLNYEGSLVSLYYSTYNTGTFKCCQYSVYQPPTRNYVFDPDFTLPQNLPPGTPMFRDVDNLSYRQSLTSCASVNSSGFCSQ
jgi:Tfp pilus assembly protein PilX